MLSDILSGNIINNYGQAILTGLVINLSNAILTYGKMLSEDQDYLRKRMGAQPKQP